MSKLLSNVKSEKEYYLASGKHTMIIRLNENVYEYFETLNGKDFKKKLLVLQISKNKQLKGVDGGVR